ncbi:MAG: RtcB family protein [Methanomicrobiales archaeon]|jgi:tRNA-splicing ligase RtcB|nr:RtcB family protein [Methanomicrobiales archaeon]
MKHMNQKKPSNISNISNISNKTESKEGDILSAITNPSELVYEIPVGTIPGMYVPGRFFLSEDLSKTLESGAVRQLAHVATLPGIINYSLAMPDIHWGYGFPIGGVAAFSMDTGVISPGGVGFDINCGVRLISTPLTVSDLNMRQIIDKMYQAIPVGVGAKSPRRLKKDELSEILLSGAAWVINEGYGLPEDGIYCEEKGCMKDARLEHISEKAFARGLNQTGTLGSGNHFMEIQVVSEIFDKEAAQAYGICEGQVCVMIHSGSRGLGHQICTDHIAALEKASKKYKIPLVDRQLACAPIHSPEGEAYYEAMAAASNYAWANRQMMTHLTRSVLADLCDIEYQEMKLVYDVAHNVAKREEHVIHGEQKQVCVHRKGATRAFGPGCPDIPVKYASIGQPVIIPGSMGTSSFLLRGTAYAMEHTFGSTCHGAGRVLSRSQAKKTFTGKEVSNSLLKQGIIVKAPSNDAISEEAPGVYKSASEVVSVVDRLNISCKVASLQPLGVIKG